MIEIDAAINKIREKLKVRTSDIYYDKIISLELIRVNNDHGSDVKDRVIDECELERYGWKKDSAEIRKLNTNEVKYGTYQKCKRK